MFISVALAGLGWLLIDDEKSVGLHIIVVYQPMLYCQLVNRKLNLTKNKSIIKIHCI